MAKKRNLSISMTKIGTMVIVVCQMVLVTAITLAFPSVLGSAQVPPRSESRQEQRERLVREALERLKEDCQGCTSLAEVYAVYALGEGNEKVANLDLKGELSIEEGYTAAGVLIIVLDAFNRATRESYERCVNEREEIFALLEKYLKQREE